MQENTNRAIVINSVVLYIRLFVTAICGLLTTRYALQALGVDDYGLFSVVGGIISFIAIFNTVMLSTSNRFIATAIGKNDIKLINATFNVNLIIHIAIAIITMTVAFPLGDWYIPKYVSYSGDIANVLMVYRISIIGSVISFVGVPYNGLLLAKERFFLFCLTDIVSSIIKTIVSYSLIFYFSDKLMAYTWTICITTAYPTLVFAAYCRKKFPEITKLVLIKDKQMYRSVFSFSVWIAYGALATVGKSQGAALIINRFFNTAMNTALGIANSVNSLLLSFANNVHKSIAPQIVKSYAAGELERSENLVILSSKVSYLMMLAISSPFIVAPTYLFGIWLGTIPDYVIVFTYLLIVDALVGSLNAGIPDLIFATGKIKSYQLIVNTIFLFSVVVGFFVLKEGLPAYCLQATYILFSIIALVIRQIVLNKVVRFNNLRLIKESYIPSILVTVLFVPISFLDKVIAPVLLLFFSVLYLIALIYIVALNKSERAYINGKLSRFFGKKI